VGNRLENLREAVTRLGDFLKSIRVSSVYETRPMYVTDQPRFLNIALSGTTGLTPEELLRGCRGIEDAMGRTREKTRAKGPRVIDLDILLYNADIVDSQQLRIPHPLMHERQFVLIPLLELAPNIRDPRTGRALADRLSELEDQGVYILGPWQYTQDAPDRP